MPPEVGADRIEGDLVMLVELELLRRQAVRSASSRSILTPACDTTPWPSADTFT
jgi:hypothetical protein